MNVSFYNNFSVGVVAIASVLNCSSELPLSKVFLIFPFCSHQKLLAHLARATTKIESLEQLIVSHTSCFSNFNQRYYDSLVLTVNALQYLCEMGYVKISEGKVVRLRVLESNAGMGRRAGSIYKAAENISRVLSGSPQGLYLNLRVEL